MATPQPARPIVLYGFTLSGHCHRAEAFIRLLGLPVQVVQVDLLAGEQRKPEFLALNRFSQVPVIDDGGVVLADSNAILVYLAKKYGAATWLPADPVGAAEVQRWLSVAAGQIAFGPAAARLITVFGSRHDPSEVIGRARALFGVMEGVLAKAPFLTGAAPTIADVACYTYIAHAPEGNVSLGDYPHLRGWLARIEALPGFVPMRKTAAGLAA